MYIYIYIFFESFFFLFFKLFFLNSFKYKFYVNSIITMNFDHLRSYVERII